MQSIIQDLRYGLRALLKKPVFTIVAVLSLGIGIGAGTSVFGIFNEQFLRPLPRAVRDTDGLVWLNVYDPLRNNFPFEFNHQNYLDLKKNNTVFSDVLASTYYGGEDKLQSGGKVRKVRCFPVSGNFFTLLGIRAAGGRVLAPEDDTGTGRPVAVVSHHLWKSFFSGDPSIVGKEILVNRIPLNVIGIAPEDFTGIDMFQKPDIYIPLRLQPQLSSNLELPFIAPVQIMARLKPGVSLAQAKAAMKTWQLPKLNPLMPGNREILVTPADEMNPRYSFLEGLSSIYWYMGILIAVVWSIPCVNIANLLLARAIDRRREIAVRATLGASRYRIIRQMLTESVLLGLFGGAVGLLLTGWITRILAATSSSHLYVGIDGKVLGMVLALSILTGLLFGIMPAIHSMRLDLSSSLKENEFQKMKPFRRFGGRNLLVIGEISASLIILVLAGLLLQGTYSTGKADLGFDTDHLFILPFNLDMDGYSEVRAWQFYSDLIPRIKALPGIHSVSLAQNPPFSFIGRSVMVFPRNNAAPGGRSMQAAPNEVGPDYFKTLNIPIERGRDFSEFDRQSDTAVIIVDETTALLFWPEQDPLGQIVMMFGPNGGASFPHTVIGTVKNASILGNQSLGNSPIIYRIISEDSCRNATLLVRSNTGTAGILPAIEHIVSELDPDMGLTGAKTLSGQIEDRYGDTRTMTFLAGILAFISLGLVTMGLYGIVSCSTGVRTREIGIRIAVGGQRKTVSRQLIKEGTWLVAIGLFMGIFPAWGAAHYIQNQFEGVDASNPLPYLGACLVLGAVALAACYIPAIKALRSDPMRALHYE